MVGTVVGNQPPTFFYLPPGYVPFPKPWPETADDYWTGFQHGIYCWILQTYLRLKASGFACSLVEDLPSEGVIVCLGPTIARDFKPSPQQFLVSIKSDNVEQPYAQIHIVQNPLDPLCRRNATIWSPYFIPLWPQTGLIGRDPNRGDRFENAAFFGHTKREIAPQLLAPEWQSELNNIGVRWTIQPADLWNDYSNVDVFVGVRSFTKKPYFHKPFTKLLNAWRAGVPAILGQDSAFKLIRRSELDYLEVTTEKELFEAIQRLKQDKGLREAMVAHGAVRAQELNNEDIVRKWRILLEEFVPQAWSKWREAANYRERFLRLRSLNAIRLEAERSIVEGYAPWLRNRPFDLDEVKSETRLYLKEARRRFDKEWERYRLQFKRKRRK